ncbi:Wzz/FepE/Etk N-terminal domain-containing protein [Avibacterium sp. 21-599]|uniref:Wzz/FepE/Etk N-terminal domain-containing protein n=1 Tax=Avibacterium sp. 21-599 TaxID=2911528 RepID=UPI002245DEF0|nr:Wzz/FepE/Etk N-terminal domain-containing protein [Avibacterium sp. 21-599]MCW9717047.1 Wzz/FepE/Etk N-terminal domain-containing protein [Avibacterium sp. 21-599]
MQSKNTAKKSFIIMLFTIIFALAGYGTSFLQKLQWKAEAKISQPTVNQLGNYYALASMYQFIQGKNEPEALLVNNVYDEFKRQVSAYDNIRQFWLQSSYYKQRETGNAQNDEELLEQLVKTVKFSTALKGQPETLSIQLDNPKQALEMLNAFIEQSNLATREVIYNELIGQWKNLFNQVSSAAQLKLGATLQANTLGEQDWQGKLNMMKSVNPLDNNLTAYRYLKSPIQPLRPERQALYWVLFAGLLGLMIGIFFTNILTTKSKKESIEE